MAVQDIVTSYQYSFLLKNNGFPQTATFAWINTAGLSSIVGPTQIAGILVPASVLTGSISAPTISEIWDWQDCTGYSPVKTASGYKFRTLLNTGVDHDVYDQSNNLITETTLVNAYAYLAQTIQAGAIRNY